MSTYTYTLDKDGNRTGMTGTGGPQTYTLDPLNRLKQAAYSGGPPDTYTYDADGNRLTKNTTSYTNNAADELMAVGSTSYTYDASGNLQARGSDSFTFNYANQLTGATVGGVTSTSTYNGDGLRMSHTANSQTANYIWDVNRGVPEILQDGTNTYVYGLGLISSTDGSGVQTYYDADGLGSTADLTNASAAKTDGYTYDAFGTATHSPGSSTQPFQFTGQQTDADSGLQYLRARYYDPPSGRFLGRDPLPGRTMSPKTQNPFVYALGNPATYVDPLGLCGWLDDPLDCAEGAASDTVNATSDAVGSTVTAVRTVAQPLASTAGQVLDAASRPFRYCLNSVDRAWECYERSELFNAGLAVSSAGAIILAAGCVAAPVMAGPAGPFIGPVTCAEGVIGFVAAQVAAYYLMRSALTPWHNDSASTTMLPNVYRLDPARPGESKE